MLPIVNNPLSRSTARTHARTTYQTPPTYAPQPLGVRSGRGLPPQLPSIAPSQSLLSFYIKVVSYRVFWIATVQLPVLPELEVVHVELKFIGDRSSILGTIITPSGKFRVK